MKGRRLLGGLLAAGRSERFGTEEKLLASVRGKPLVTYAARQLQQAECDGLASVATASVYHAIGSDYARIEPAGAQAGLGDNLAALARFAEAEGYSRLLVCLGDMPLVPATHLIALAAMTSHNSPAATIVRGRPQVPCCFPQPWFKRLAWLAGDQGAGMLLAKADCHAVALDPTLAMDVDDRDALDQLARFLGSDRLP